SQSNMLTLASQIHVLLTGANATVIQATHGVITNEPRQIVLDHPHLERDGSALQSDRATFFLNTDNNVERVLAAGNIDAKTQRAHAGEVKKNASTDSSQQLQAMADEAEVRFTGTENRLRTATLTGNVRVEQSGAQSMQGNAGRVVVDFVGRNEVQKVHAENDV